MNILAESTIFLAAAAVAAPLSRYVGLGAVLGYVLAGMAIGPFGLGLIDHPDSILHFAEIGIVFLLFLIGLELQPARLKVLRHGIFVVGLLQVATTTVVLTAVIALAHLDTLTGALLIGFSLSLSSTAFALQLLAESGGLLKPYGRTSFATLLFQDLAVIPAIAIISTLSVGKADAGDGSDLAVAMNVLILIAYVVAAHYTLRPLLRLIAKTEVHEAFTAAGLLLVIGSALLFEWLGLSLGLGAFIAGVLMADSQFRHQLEGDIEPFKGLLLGLFFIAVGMSANLGLLAERPFAIVAMVAGLVAVKALILYTIGVRTGLARGSARQYALFLSQGGEFAFVLFAQASAGGLVEPELAELMTVVVTLSMAVTPVLLFVDRRWVSSPAVFAPAETPAQVFDRTGSVIIAGFGRFGQVVARILRSQGIPFTALDYNQGQIDFVSRFGNKVYYGDASRLPVLRAAGIDEASVFVIAISDPDKSLTIAEQLIQHFPHIEIFARARDRQHEIRLRAAGVTHVIRETLLSSIFVGSEVLQALGLDADEAVHVGEVFLKHDEKTLTKQIEVESDPAELARLANDSARELREIFRLDDETDREEAREAQEAEPPATPREKSGEGLPEA